MNYDEQKYRELVKRWDNFLDKINRRFEESLGHAKEAVLSDLEESDYDMGQVTVAWSGIKAQLQNLSDKIEKTYENEVKPQMLQYKREHEILNEYRKGVILSESFYPRTERFQIELEGEIGMIFYRHAIKFLDENFKCTQCGAQLKVKKDIFRSQYISCNYCNTVNTFKPHAKVSEIRGFAINNIVKYHCLAEYDEMIKARQEFNELRMPAEQEDKTELLKAFEKREKTERAYWMKYFIECSKLLPEYVDRIEKDVANKMEYFYLEKNNLLNS